MIAAAIERCGGIDVGKKFLAVCIMVGPLEGEPRVEIQRFGTTVLELRRLRDWLKQEGITHVVMESTGSYWKPVFNILEDAVKVYLANPQDVKNRKGHKTDNKDGWWLAHLLRHAMIQPSFIPPRAIRELRDLTRRRRRLLGNGSSEKNRVQKILEDANVKLGNVLADVFGVSGQLMLEALLEGKAGPQEIAQLAKRRARQRIPEIAAALEEHQMNAHHRQMIRYSLQHMQFLEQQIIQLDKDIAQKIGESGLETEWKLLQSVPGVQANSAATILAETGTAMQQFGDEKHFSSWAGVCPGNNRSAGKEKSSHTTGGDPWLRSALTECAWGRRQPQNVFPEGEVLARRHQTRREEGPGGSSGRPYVSAHHLCCPGDRPTVSREACTGANAESEGADHPASRPSSGEVGSERLCAATGPAPSAPERRINSSARVKNSE